MAVLYNHLGFPLACRCGGYRCGRENRSYGHLRHEYTLIVTFFKGFLKVLNVQMNIENVLIYLDALPL